MGGARRARPLDPPMIQKLRTQTLNLQIDLRCHTGGKIRNRCMKYIIVKITIKLVDLNVIQY